MMPSLTAWLINEMDFRQDTTQLPIAQLGCAAGAAAIGRADDFCRSHADTNVLVIACEFCSLTYQPDDLAVGNLLSSGLFGDAISAAVVRSDDEQPGIKLLDSYSYVVPNTTSWISYEVRESGFHFRLNKGVPSVLKEAMPALTEFVLSRDRDLRELDFYAIHTGGPRVLNALHDPGGVPQAALVPSLETLRDYGNVASVSVFDVIKRIAQRGPAEGQDGIIVGFGPGITMEAILGTWTCGRQGWPQQRAPKEAAGLGIR
jgi:1,3,6,8-tetrahydroxynaphthalene synthase